MSHVLAVQKGVGSKAKVLLRIEKDWPLLTLGISLYNGLLLMLKHNQSCYLGSFSAKVAKDGRMNYYQDPVGSWHVAIKLLAKEETDLAYGVVVDAAGGQYFRTTRNNGFIEMTMLQDSRLKKWSARGSRGRADLDTIKRVAVERLQEVA